MRFYHRLIRNLVLPSDAGVGDSRFVAGPDLPPPLDTYLFFNLALADSALIWYSGILSDTNYEFLAQITTTGDTERLVLGSVRSGLVLESDAANNIPAGQHWLLDTLTGVSQIDFKLGAVGTFKIDAVDQPRGLVDFQTLIANTGPLAVETVVWNSNKTWKNDRCYRFDIRASCQPAGGATGAQFTIRRIGLGGGGYVQRMTHPFNGANDSMAHQIGYLRNTTGADIAQNLAITVMPQALVGTVDVLGGAAFVGSVEVTDCGDASNYPNINTVV